VNAIDVSEDGKYVIGAYKTGKLALFEITKGSNQLAFLMTNMTRNSQKEFSSVKFLSTDDNMIVLITGEKCGRVNVIKLTPKTVMMFQIGYNMTEHTLYINTHKQLCTISIRPSSKFVSETTEFLNKASLAAIAGSEKLSIVMM
jgi:hypothetical protein